MSRSSFAAVAGTVLGCHGFSPQMPCLFGIFTKDPFPVTLPSDLFLFAIYPKDPSSVIYFRKTILLQVLVTHYSTQLLLFVLKPTTRSCPIDFKQPVSVIMVVGSLIHISIKYFLLKFLFKLYKTISFNRTDVGLKKKPDLLTRNRYNNFVAKELEMKR